ncbi:auxin response factor 4-like [Cynara cardunculus var. scolymus]|uniref:auxin response factor 4-like n=1 Tax=Cynara cardunculus var. scolymus TaxID=59895 RepID=UPI000D62F7C7|nr:auxin response factor 4-like [Cynara cardunculus var. scolymus]
MFTRRQNHNRNGKDFGYPWPARNSYPDSNHRKSFSLIPDSQNKVLKHGTALGRSVELSRFIGYEGLIVELDRMFEFDGRLVSGTSGWVVTFADGYGNKMLLGDRLWSQFKAVVRKMTIESAATVS